MTINKNGDVIMADTKLKDELKLDPKGLGYKGKRSQKIADMLNTVGLSNEKGDNADISADDIYAALDMSEFGNFNAKQQGLINLSLTLGGIQPKKSMTNIRTTIQSQFADMPISQAALMALTYKNISRAEVLGLPIVKDVDVERITGTPIYEEIV